MATQMDDELSDVLTRLLAEMETAEAGFLLSVAAGNQMLAALKAIQEHFRQFGEASMLAYKVDEAIKSAEAVGFGRSG